MLPAAGQGIKIDLRTTGNYYPNHAINKY